MSDNLGFNSPALDAAVALHEIFLTMVQAGFTEDQALTMVIELLINAGK